ncbi:MAG: hypothetical protein JWM16_2985, partial [Verrucomicrobiales bacterium]|nr:hypothetical protein [Verrucomicrobiales bacterium]
MIDLTPKGTLHRITQFTPALLLLHAGTAAGEEHGADRNYGLYELLPTLAWPCAALGVATLFFLAYRLSRQKELALAGTSPVPSDQLFTQEHITQTFISAIPTLTQELNLEVATAQQVETFERIDEKRVFWGWMNLGTNTARIRVPVTYRFHIRLYETWRLEVNGSALVVHAPAIRP